MNDLTVNIICQYWENYGHYEGRVHWKPKGSIPFSIVIDHTKWAYDDERCKYILTKLIAGRCNDLVKYEIVEFETVLDKPIDITEEFNKEYSHI